MQIREEDKDPVYKYFESMMTCARVREFNSKPPPQVSILPEILNTQTLITSETQDDGPKTYFRTVLNPNKAGKEPKQSLSQSSDQVNILYSFCFPAHPC